jgi:hypothetical protein
MGGDSAIVRAHQIVICSVLTIMSLSSVPNSSHIMISLMRKRRVGSVVRFGGYQISAQELFDQDLESSGMPAFILQMSKVF